MNKYKYDVLVFIISRISTSTGFIISHLLGYQSILFIHGWSKVRMKLLNFEKGYNDEGNLSSGRNIGY